MANSNPSIEQLRGYIMEAVESLRQRKCRPDRETIAHFVLRKYGAEFNQVFSELENTVDEGHLLKVEYKGTTSYRLPSNFDQKSSPLLTKHSKILNSNRTTRLIVSSISEILQKNPEYNTSGIPIEMLKENLSTHEPERFAIDKLGVILEREYSTGNLVLVNEDRVFPKDLKKQVFAVKSEPGKDGEVSNNESPSAKGKGRGLGGAGRKVVAEKVAAAVRKTFEDAGDGGKNMNFKLEGEDGKEKEKKGGNKTPNTPAAAEAQQQPTSGGRSVRNKRKREVFDPSDFEPKKKGETVGKVKGKDSKETPDKEMKCAYCKKFEIPPDDALLNCCDCNTKIHLSCYFVSDYSEEAKKRVLSQVDTWRCCDCKLCPTCQNILYTGRDIVLVCYNCDDGYHMKKCLKIEKKPPKADFWECSNCTQTQGIITEAVGVTNTSPLSTTSVSKSPTIETNKESTNKEKETTSPTTTETSSAAEIDSDKNDKKEENVNVTNSEDNSSIAEEEEKSGKVETTGELNENDTSKKTSTTTPPRKKIGRPPKPLKSQRGVHPSKRAKVAIMANEGMNNNNNENPGLLLSSDEDKKIDGEKENSENITKIKEKGDLIVIKKEIGDEKDENNKIKSSTVNNNSSKSDNQIVKRWSPGEVEDYFKTKGLIEEGAIFREQDIDGMSLLMMRRQDVIYGMRLRLGPALKVYRVIYDLQTKTAYSINSKNNSNPNQTIADSE